MSSRVHPLLQRVKDVIDAYLHREGIHASTSNINGATIVTVNDIRYPAPLQTKADVVGNRDVRLSLLIIPSTNFEEYNCVNTLLQKLIRDDGMTIYYDDITSSVAAASKFNAIRFSTDAEQISQEIKDTLDELHEWRNKRQLAILTELKKCRG